MTQEEILEYNKKLIETARKTHNKYIRVELYRIDGYLRGLYKQFSK